MPRNLRSAGSSFSLPCVPLTCCQNTEDLARWLDAKYYVSNYKPVPVQEFLVCENRIYPTAGSETTDVHLVSSGALEPRQASRASTKPVRVIEPSKHPELKRHFMNTVVSLTLETVTAGFGVLVFCGSRAGCQSTAALVAKAMPDDISKELVERRREVLDSLKCLMLPVDSVLEVTIMCGVAFHREYLKCSSPLLVQTLAHAVQMLA